MAGAERVWRGGGHDPARLADHRREDGPLLAPRRGQARRHPDARHTPAWGQIHEIPDLFISDDSQFTTGAAENPTLTIVALVIRQAKHIANEMDAGKL